jgi:hypothetical protein
MLCCLQAVEPVVERRGVVEIPRQQVDERLIH